MPPANTALPAITGTATQGQTLAASTGTWTGSPTSFAYRWRSCDASGASCVDITGATSSTYVLQGADAGRTVRVVVTATNAAGSTPATSAQSAVVAGLPPANTALPAISGSAQQGQTLTSSTGTWSGSPTSFAYRWRDCDVTGNACNDIAGATAQNYVAQASDLGSTLRVVVTATNAFGSTPATSAQTTVVGGLPPSNTVLPAITGAATQGQTLAASTGTWAGSPTSFAYRWRDCDTAGANCVDIAGAASSTYVLQLSDVAHTLRVVVTATNAAGSTPATSAQTAVVAGLPPANTALPAITGTATQGQTLAASTGTWTGSPTSFAYRWRDCDTTGANCADISAATSSTYVLVGADVGHTVRVVVTATNGAGSTPATSAQTGIVAGLPPANTVLPAITGTATQGQTLTASTGTWTGSPTSFAYRWRDCDTAGANCVDITGATNSTYVLQAADAGHTVRVVVTATNAAGSTPATSVQTAVVGGVPPSNTALPAITGTAQQGQTLTASTGTWTGSPTSFAYRWRDCDAAGATCADITGATNSTYVLQAADVGHTVRVVVTATNPTGSTPATSSQTATVVGPLAYEHRPARRSPEPPARADPHDLERHVDGQSDLLHVSLARLRHVRRHLRRHRGGDDADVRAAGG